MLSGPVPAAHALPSLDGSLSSDQISNVSSPATPELRAAADGQWGSGRIRVRRDQESLTSADGSSTGMLAEEDLVIETSSDDCNPLIESFPEIPSLQEVQESAFGGAGLRSGPACEGADEIVLPPEAMATLRQIPLDSSATPWSDYPGQGNEMVQLPEPPSQPPVADDATPASDLSKYSFTNLSVPSPRQLFPSVDSSNQPTTAVAERFYNVPWRREDNSFEEQVAEQSTSDDHGAVTGDPSLITQPPSNRNERASFDSQSHDSSRVVSVQELDRSGVAFEYDEQYDEQLKQKALKNLDRTSLWLAAQASYLAALRETNPANKIESNDSVKEEARVLSGSASAPSNLAPSSKNEGPVTTREGSQEVITKDSIYWRGFQFLLQRCQHRDAFLHRNTRFEAVHSVRVGLIDRHLDALMGKFEISKPERPPYTGPFSRAPRNSDSQQAFAEQKLYSELEKERIVLAQLYQSFWAIEALRFLNGGRLLISPAGKRLEKANAVGSLPKNIQKRSRLRVLDLGGQATGGWAWHIANDFPNVKVYTVVTEDQVVNRHVSRPRNHRLVLVPHLWKLPFRDNQFDVISARSMHAFLKSVRPEGEDMDEIDLCLRECYRCLKPGGCLEFCIMDAEIARAGPYGSATSAEFAVNLKLRGYDSCLTKRFVHRLINANFVNIKRAWMFLPMGVEPAKPQPLRETPDPRVRTRFSNYEAVHGPVGSTGDIANITGLLGGWMWEQWMLKLQLEIGHSRDTLLKNIGRVFDEGRKQGSGWTTLNGWTMKPGRREASQ